MTSNLSAPPTAAEELRKAARWLASYRRELKRQGMANQHWMDGVIESVLHLRERAAKLEAMERKRWATYRLPKGAKKR